MIHAYNLLTNGMGGLSLQALPVVVGLLGPPDIDLLVHGVQVVRRHGSMRREG